MGRVCLYFVVGLRLVEGRRNGVWLAGGVRVRGERLEVICNISPTEIFFSSKIHAIESEGDMHLCARGWVGGVKEDIV